MRHRPQSDCPPGDDNGFPGQLRVIPLPDGSIKCLEIDMHDFAHGHLAIILFPVPCFVGSWPEPAGDCGRFAGLVHSKLLCHKRAIRFEPLCANVFFFDTYYKCFRAGLIKGK
jgi:hypothetical protein